MALIRGPAKMWNSLTATTLPVMIALLLKAGEILAQQVRGK